MRKADLRAYLDFIYAYELSHGKDPLLRVRATKEDLEYMIRTMPRRPAQKEKNRVVSSELHTFDYI
jgi:hypothetical protein